jgi:hypothetical protein
MTWWLQEEASLASLLREKSRAEAYLSLFLRKI